MYRKIILISFLLFNVSLFAQTTHTPYMNLPVSTIGQASGLLWEQNLNTALSTLDSHNHSPGYGQQITPNGMNINSDLSFSSHNATALRTTRYSAQSTTIPNSGPDVCELFTSGNDLYYNDCTGGNTVRITFNGSVNAGAGSIGGLPSGTASVNFAAGKYTFQSATNVAANIDGRSYILRNSSASSYGLTLNPPAAMAGNISQTLPTVPIEESFVTMDASGNFLSAIPISGGIEGSNIAAGTIEGSNIDSATITNTNIANTTIALGKLATLNVLTIATSGTTSVVVPANVSNFIVQGCGGGGGGGSGGGGHTAPGGGGAGGEGAPLNTYTLVVTPNSTLTAVIPTAAAGGAQVGNDVGGNPGANGGTVTFSSLSFYGGGLGNGGLRSTGGGTGAAVTQLLTNGNPGTGGANSSAGSASDALKSSSSLGGTGGGSGASNRGGPGGAGGAGGNGAGANGGDAGATPNGAGGAGSSAAANTCAGGGGGAGGSTGSPNSSVTVTGGAGGNGGTGIIRIYY